MLVPLALQASCSLPAEDEGFTSREPASRVRAAALSNESSNQTTIRELIVTLDSDDPAARMVASASLRRQTGQDFGYSATAPEPARKAAADRWEAWYRRTYLGQDAPDPFQSLAGSAEDTMTRAQSNQ